MAKKASKAPKYPQTLYVRWAGEEPDQYLDASKDASALSEVDRTLEVAVYELKRIGKVTNKTELS